MNGILIVAHAPLASALRQCALHVFPDSTDAVQALDVLPDVPPEETLAQARLLMAQSSCPEILVLADIFGATPCNVAQQLVDGVRSRLIAGVNLPMLLRAMCYRQESLDALVGRALAGASQGVVQVDSNTPQNQSSQNFHDQDHCDHQQ